MTDYYTSNEYLSIKAFWNEPDIWEDTIEGYLCCARRNYSKAWCGYIRVPASHPMVPNDNLECHGGITWNQNKAPWMNEEDKGWFWYGFDCSHYLDLSPQDVFKDLFDQDSWRREYRYKDLPYVKQNINSLAQQLRALEEVPGHA
ncbi:MAG TPA: hypothetical protein VIM69_10495 [Opitutaceae bacterium]